MLILVERKGLWDKIFDGSSRPEFYLDIIKI